MIDKLIQEKIGKFTSILEKSKSKVRIPFKKSDLGLHLDSPLDDYKKALINKKKTWDEMSAALNALYIYNKNNHPDVAKQATAVRLAMKKWVEDKRKDDPNFAR